MRFIIFLLLFAILFQLESCNLDNHEESYSFEYYPFYLTQTQKLNEVELFHDTSQLENYFFIENDFKQPFFIGPARNIINKFCSPGS